MSPRDWSEARDAAAQTEEANAAARDEVASQRREDWAGIYDDDPGDQEPNPLIDAPDARNRPDPWDVWTCQKCGGVTDSQPEVCPTCGLRNYGFAAEEERIVRADRDREWWA